MLEMLLAFKKVSEIAVSGQWFPGELVKFGSAVQLYFEQATLEPVLCWACTKQCPDCSQNYIETVSINTTPLTSFLVSLSPKRKKISKYYINAQNC